MSDALLLREEELDRFVAAFEAASQRDGRTDLARFLPDRDHPLYLTVLCELVRVDLEFRWTRGTPRPLDDYRQEFPELLDDPDWRAAVEYEDERLRRQAEECRASQRAREAAQSEHPANNEPDCSDWPKLGSKFAGFQLLSELGRGTFARVYLARQPGLADRLVAIKVSRELAAESDWLARLQHPNIVPIHSVHHQGPFHAICMPFLGATTLADVLRDRRPDSTDLPLEQVFAKTLRAGSTQGPSAVASSRTASSRSTSELATASTDTASTLDQRGETFVASRTHDLLESTCWTALAGLSYVDAVLWIAARLADGLQHAHERGILHRDLKPANILLADDGQPMLLDFNLSELATPPTEDAVTQGGTLPYMAPEVLRAFQMRRKGGDQRSDLYSLGVVLFELLTGRQPFSLHVGASREVVARMLTDRAAGLPRFPCTASGITPAVESIVQRCLAHDPEKRYQSAAELREDLERHARHLPLKHAPEPSWRERGRKWTKRHPRLTSGAVILFVAGLLLAMLGTMAAWRGRQVAAWEAHDAWQTFQQEVAQVQVECLEAPNADAQRFQELLDRCQRTIDRSAQLARHEAAWSAEERIAWQRSVADVYFLQAALARLDAAPDAIERACAANRQALELCPSPAPLVFLRQQKELQIARGRAEILNDATQSSHVESEESLATMPTPSTDATSTRDAGLIAVWYSAQRRYEAALPWWRQATHGEPRSVWAWYGLGYCQEQLQHPADAVAAYSACIALAPDESRWYLRRGLACLRLDEFAGAESDFSQAILLTPSLHEARVNRAIARLGANRPRAALDDLISLPHDFERSRVLLLVATAKRERGDMDGAAQAHTEALRCDPTDDLGWVACGVARIEIEPRQALSDFDRALAICPHSLAAFENKAHVLSERLNRCEDAIQTLTMAIDAHPEAAGVHASRGVLRARLGRFDGARQDAEAALTLSRSPEIEYQVAGIYALASRESAADATRALSLLTSALRRGFGATHLTDDPDLEPLREHAPFQQLRQAVETLWPEARRPHVATGAVAR